MPRESATIIAELNCFVGSNTNWQTLDELVAALFENPVCGAGLDALLGVFERHPTHDGFGVFWTLLHGIESVPCYEVHLFQSLRRRPSLFGVYMVNRILNGGVREVGPESWISGLRNVASRDDVEQEIRDEAGKYLQRHAGQCRD